VFVSPRRSAGGRSRIQQAVAIDDLHVVKISFDDRAAVLY
jgi:hypothetical protein